MELPVERARPQLVYHPVFRPPLADRDRLFRLAFILPGGVLGTADQEGEGWAV